jgi:hypothetical protein
MLIPNLFFFKGFFVLFVINLLENVLEFAIILLQNGVFGGQIQRILSVQSELE